MKHVIIFLIILSTKVYSQNQKVEMPKKMDFRYWSFDMRKELNYDNITKSNNLYWKSKIDPKLNESKKKYWNYLKKRIKTIKEEVYTNYKDKENEKEETNIYKYDSRGNILEKIRFYDKNNEKYYGKTIIKYNKNSNIIEYTEYSCNSFTKNKEKLEKRYLFAYDKNQNLIMEKEENSTIKKFSYNKNNKVEKIEYFGFDPNQYGLVAYTAETTEEEIQNYINKLKSKLLIKYTFKYNTSGDVILEKKEEVIKSRYNVHTFTHTYLYNKDRTLSNFSTENFTIDYQYNKDKLLTSEILTELKSNKVKKATREYNKKGNLIRYRSPGDYGSSIYSVVYEYDRGNVARKINYEESYGKKQKYASTIYEYDKKGFLTKSIRTDSDDGEVTHEVYAYDNNEKLLDYYRKNVSKDEVYNIEKYRYDENGAVVESVWNYSIKRVVEYY